MEEIKIRDNSSEVYEMGEPTSKMGIPFDILISNPKPKRTNILSYLS